MPSTLKAIPLLRGVPPFVTAHTFYASRGIQVSWHSRPQSPQSLWSAPGIETSGRDRSRKSANNGLPAFVRSLRNLNNNGYYRLKMGSYCACALPGPCQRSRSLAQTKGIVGSGDENGFLRNLPTNSSRSEEGRRPSERSEVYKFVAWWSREDC